MVTVGPLNLSIVKISLRLQISQKFVSFSDVLTENFSIPTLASHFFVGSASQNGLIGEIEFVNDR